jgi:hypothetical protein
MVRKSQKRMTMKRMTMKRMTQKKRVRRKLRKTYRKQSGGATLEEQRTQRDLKNLAKKEAAQISNEERRSQLTPEELAAEDEMNERNKKANQLGVHADKTGLRNQYQNDSNLLDLGKLQDDLNAKFNYKTFDKVAGNIVKQVVGNKYSLYSFGYLVGDQLSPVILKLPTDPTIFILYEYIAGQYVNTLCKQYPCFLETYNYVINNNKDEDGNVIPIEKGEPSDFPYVAGDARNDAKKLLNSAYISGNEPAYQYKEACSRPTDIAVLIQYLPNTMPTIKLLQTKIFRGCANYSDKAQKKELIQCANNMTYKFMCFLFQIYIPLAQLKDKFSHNNLTLDQILCFTPFPKEFFTFNYIFDEKTTITFESDYIVKIKNYEKCYFKQDDTFNSDKIFQEMVDNGCTSFIKPKNEILNPIKTELLRPSNIPNNIGMNEHNETMNKLFKGNKNIVDIAAIIKKYMETYSGDKSSGFVSKSLGQFTVYMDGSGKSMTYQHTGSIKNF